MPVPIPTEVILAAIAVGLLALAILVAEVLVFFGGLRRIPRRATAIFVALLGLGLGLVASAFDWIDPEAARLIIVPGVIVIGAAVMLALVVWRTQEPTPLLVGALGAAILFQLAWAAGRTFLPQLPVVGPALEAARCERSPYCSPAGTARSANLHVEIATPKGVTVADGSGECTVDTRPEALLPLKLAGTLRVNGGGDLQLDIGVMRSEDPSRLGEPVVTASLSGAIAGYTNVDAEAYGSAAGLDLSNEEALAAGTLTLDRMHMNRLQRDPERQGLMWLHDPALDSSTADLTWSCS